MNLDTIDYLPEASITRESVTPLQCYYQKKNVINFAPLDEGMKFLAQTKANARAYTRSKGLLLRIQQTDSDAKCSEIICA